MANYTRWILYNQINEHPEDSILLAYLRGQALENHSSVIQHIDRVKCPVCLQKLNELKQVSTTLDVLGEMRSHQYYPELSVADTFVRMQSTVNPRIPVKTARNGANYRQLPRRSAVRLISVPVAFGLAIIFTMAMLVFANLSGSSFNPFSFNGGTSSDQNILTVVVPPHSTATQKAKLTATAVVTPGRSSKALSPQIKVCSTHANIAQLRLVICGFGFDSSDKAILVFYVPGKGVSVLRNIPVDKHGKFQVGWNLADCGNVPAFIYGYEVTRSKPIIVKMQITSFGSCPVPTSTPGVKPSGFSRKSGI
jgi:hypothetical protein